MFWQRFKPGTSWIWVKMSPLESHCSTSSYQCTGWTKFVHHIRNKNRRQNKRDCKKQRTTPNSLIHSALDDEDGFPPGVARKGAPPLKNLGYRVYTSKVHLDSHNIKFCDYVCLPYHTSERMIHHLERKLPSLLIHLSESKANSFQRVLSSSSGACVLFSAQSSREFQVLC